MTYTWPTAESPQGWIRSIFKIKVGNWLIPIGLIWVLIAVLVFSLILHKTRPGRYMCAVGSNKESARLSGVNVRRFQALAYVISGFMAGIAGVTYAVTFKSITAGSGGGFELDAITAAVIGGVSVTGGSGSIWGTFLGVLAISILKAGLPFIGLQANWQQICIGVVLALAVYLDLSRNRKAGQK